MPLRKVNPGDPIRASDYNALVEAVEQLMNLSGGPGVRVSMDAGGPKVALSDDRREVKRSGTITQVFRDGQPWVPDGKAQDATRISYAARPYRAYEETIVTPEMVTRYLNRPNTRGTVTVYPAGVGDPCEIWRVPGADGEWEFYLELLTEEIEFVKKCKDPGGRPGGPGGDPNNPDAPQIPDQPGGSGFSVGAPGAGPGGGVGAGGAAGH